MRQSHIEALSEFNAEELLWVAANSNAHMRAQVDRVLEDRAAKAQARRSSTPTPAPARRHALLARAGSARRD
ncbi:MAG: hypothetical protein KF864_03545 [Phycisphaeraceae bacterium]|nr:hypothetical protein [Phycisphaeraceae bacterium]